MTDKNKIIRFRGKTVDDGEWIIGGYPHLERTSTGEMALCITSIPGGESRFVRPDTIGEFSGVLDKNGKCIFEEDIVKGLFLFCMEVNGVCEFRNGSYGLRWERGSAVEFSAFTSICNIKFEVIGNIFDNPELLDEGGDNK